MSSPLVSVIINCYNGEKYLREAIDSVYAQTYKNWEIIFWDNASIDSTPLIANSYDSKLRYFRSDKNLKLYSARNHALKKCKGEFIALLDSDDVWLKEKLELQIPVFDDMQIGLVYSNSVVLYDSGRERVKNKSKLLPEGMIFSNLLVNYCIDINTVVIRKKLIDDHGLVFLDSLNITGDLLFFLKVSYVSKVKPIRLVLAKWRNHGSNLSVIKADLLSNELKISILDLIKSYPEIIYTYEAEILRFITNIYIQESKYYLLNGRTKLVKERLSNRKFRSIKIFILWLLSYDFLSFLIKYIG